MNQEKIGVVGLGYIGLTLAAALANVGFKVIGIDTNKSTVGNLQNNKRDIYEPGLSETLERCKASVEFTTDYAYLMKSCSSIIITVATPIDDNEAPNRDHLNAAVSAIGQYLREGQLIVLKSTVVPGTTEEVCQELGNISGLTAGKDFYVAYCPERTIEGLALHELYTLPKVIGGINTESTKQAATVLRKLGGKVIEVSSPRVAEVAKLADNLYRAMNIGFANELGLICEKLNIDAYEMVSSVNEAYARTNLFKPGLGAAGPCLAKDPQILNYYARQKGLDTELIGACISVNKKVNSRISSVVSRYLQAKNLQSPKIAVVGLAFKGFPETDDLRGSPAVEIVANLKKGFSQCQFSYHDPIVKSFLGNIPVSSIDECLKDSNVVLFLTNHPSLMNIEVNQILERTARPLLVVDCWHNISNPAEISQQRDVEIVRIGDGRV